jgi:hypothetical protein
MGARVRRAIVSMDKDRLIGGLLTVRSSALNAAIAATRLRRRTVMNVVGTSGAACL